jgi:hypothetical protein
MLYFDGIPEITVFIFLRGTAEEKLNDSCRVPRAVGEVPIEELAMGEMASVSALKVASVPIDRRV